MLFHPPRRAHPKTRPLLWALTLTLLLPWTPGCRLQNSPEPAPEPARPGPLPRLMLWAWERPEDLTFVDPEQVGVAFLLATAELRGDRVTVRPRRQRLLVPPATQLEAVVRVESDFHDPPNFSSKQCRELASAIVSLAEGLEVHRLQVDFDARASERPGYRRLLNQIRRQWPVERPLAITALASWCIFDDWLGGLPVDGVVPMLFQMGPDGARVLHHLRTQGRFRTGLASLGWGVSTDELSLRPPPGQRLYVFHPRPWTPPDLEELKRWLDD